MKNNARSTALTLTLVSFLTQIASAGILTGRAPDLIHPEELRTEPSKAAGAPSERTPLKTGAYEGGKPVGIGQQKTALSSSQSNQLSDTISANAYGMGRGADGKMLSKPMATQRTSESGTNKFIMHGNLSALKGGEREKVMANLVERSNGGDVEASNTLAMISQGLDARFTMNVEVKTKDGSSLNSANLKSTGNLDIKYSDVQITFDSKLAAHKGDQLNSNGAVTGRFNSANADTYSAMVQDVSFKVDTIAAMRKNMNVEMSVSDLNIKQGGEPHLDTIHVKVPEGKSVPVQSPLGSVGSISAPKMTDPGANKADYEVTLLFTPASAKASGQDEGVSPLQITMGAVAAQQPKNEAVTRVIESDQTNAVTTLGNGEVMITSSRPEGINVGEGIRRSAVGFAKTELGLNTDQFTVALSKTPGRDGASMVTASIVLNPGQKADVNIGDGKTVAAVSSSKGAISYTYNPLTKQVSNAQLSGGAVAVNKWTFAGAAVKAAVQQTFQKDLSSKGVYANAVKALNNSHSMGVVAGASSLVGRALSAIGVKPAAEANSPQSARNTGSIAKPVPSLLGAAAARTLSAVKNAPAFLSAARETIKNAESVASRTDTNFNAAVASPAKFTPVTAPSMPKSQTELAVNPLDMFLQGYSR